MIGSGLLVMAPDGSQLGTGVGASGGSPFTDWRQPGLLLGLLVAIGFLTTGAGEWRRGRHAQELAVLGLTAVAGNR